MKNLMRSLLLPLLFIAGSASAVPIVSLSAAGQTTTSVANTTTIDFNSGCGYASCSGDFILATGSQSGLYAQPFGTNTQYLSVPNPSTSSLNADFSLGAAANYFGLFWGSIDSYNFISFYLNNTLVASYSGSSLVGQFANGNQLSYSSNRYINFDFGNSSFDSVKLTSHGFAFESDNHAFRKLVSVTEPSTAILLLFGLVSLTLMRRQLKTIALK
jgi:hypothetical protein